MSVSFRAVCCIFAFAVSSQFVVGDNAWAQAARRDAIGELLAEKETAARKDIAGVKKTGQASDAATDGATGEAAAEPADPREGDPEYEKARALMRAIDNVLRNTAEQRAEAKKLPSKDEFVVSPLWTETREDREDHVRDLLDSALAIVTDVPIVEMQKKIEGLRGNIKDLEETRVGLREKQLTAPKDGLLPGMWTDTVGTLQSKIEDTEKRIAENREAIVQTKVEINEGFKKAGLDLNPDQVDLLIDSVLSDDLVRLVAAFNAAKLIDAQLGNLLTAAGDNLAAARKYFAMHAALFAMLVHAQEAAINKIDNQYMPRLDAILKDIAAAKRKTAKLMRAENRPDQRRALEANRDSQKTAEAAAKAYRKYLTQQREQIAVARTRTTHDLRIADNTYETVEASFQLRTLMRDSVTSFEALQKLEAPTFDQIFRNETLREEFENLTRKLNAPSS